MHRGLRRETYAVGAAVAVHVALLLGSPRPPLRPHEAASLDHADATIDLEPEAPAPPPAALPAAPEPTEAAEAEAPAKGPSARPGAVAAKVAVVAKEPALEPPSAGSRAGNPEAKAPPAPGPPPAAGKPGGDEYGGPVGGSDVAALPPGLGGAHLWSIPGMIPGAAPPKPAATVASGPPPVDPNVAGQVLTGSLGRKDKAIGIDLPAAGTVATTLADAVRTAAPLNARATFEVKLGAGGQVEGVRLVSASDGDAGTWSRVVAAAKGTLGARALQVSGDGKAATVTVKVESKVQYPAGSEHKFDVTPVCAEEELAKMVDTLQNGLNPDLARGPRAEPGMAALPPADDDAPKKRKFCIPIGIRGTFDASNFGAHAVNVVKSTFSVSRAGDKALDPDAVRPIDTRVPWAPEDPTKVRPAMPKKKKKKKGP